jgi:hypothetical protein
VTATLHPVLLAALRDEPDHLGARVRDDADWDAVVARAEAESLTPLLRRRLRRAGLL